MFPVTPSETVSGGTGDAKIKNNESAAQTPVFPNPNPAANEAFSIPTKEAYPVFIPYNKEGKIGNLYYIPEDFYRLLLQGGQSQMSGKWQIQKANYIGTLIRDPIQNEITLFNLKAIYEIELTEHSASVRLPEMPILPDGARCDRQLIQPIFSSAEKEFIFVINGQGRHQLELSLVPVIYDELASRRFEFTIPSVPDSTLELTYPNTTLPLDVRNVLGKINQSAGNFKAELGPVKNLSVSWLTKQMPSGRNQIGTEQYFWLDVTSSQTRLYAQYRFNAAASSTMTQVQIAVDPRYRQDGDYSVSGGTAKIDSITVQNGVATINFNNPVTENITLRAGYILKNISGGDFSGMGTISLPNFSVINTRINRSWLAVSSGNGAQIEPPIPNIETKMFESYWGSFAELGEKKQKISYAYDLQRLLEHWFLSVKKRPIAYQAEHRQWIFYKNKTIQTLVETEITPSYSETNPNNFNDANANASTISTAANSVISESGTILPSEKKEANTTLPTFFYVFHTPKNFRCESVTIKNADGVVYEKPRIEQQNETLTLFFRNAVIGKFTVSMSGTVSLKQNQQIAFPMITHENNTAADYWISSYRDTSVLAEQKIADASIRVTENAANQIPAEFSGGIFLSSFQVASFAEFSQSQVLIKPNKPRVAGKMISRLNRTLNSGHWNMTVDCSLTITQGELDQIMISTAVNLDETAEVFPKPDFYLVQTKKNNDTLFQIKPQKPLAGQHHFRLQFPVNGNLDSFTVPDVQFRTNGNVEKYLVLQRQFIGKVLDWTKLNLTAVEASGDLLPKIESEDETTKQLTENPEQYWFYRMNGNDSSAMLKTFEQPSCVLCQDVSFFVRKNRACCTVSVFDLQNYGLSHCDVKIPANHQLLQIQADNYFPLPNFLSDNVYRVELPKDAQIQRITIVTCFVPPPQKNVSSVSSKSVSSKSVLPKIAEETASVILPFPSILGLTVRKTLWEVYYENVSNAVNFNTKLTSTEMKIGATLHFAENPQRLLSQKTFIPLNAQNAAALQSRVLLFRQNQLLTILKNAAPQSAGHDDEQNRYRAWYEELRENEKRIKRFSESAETENASWTSAFLRTASPEKNGSEPPEPQISDISAASFVNDCFSQKKVSQLCEDALKETARQYASSNSPFSSDENATLSSTRTSSTTRTTSPSSTVSPTLSSPSTSTTSPLPSTLSTSSPNAAAATSSPPTSRTLSPPTSSSSTRTPSSTTLTTAASATTLSTATATSSSTLSTATLSSASAATSTAISNRDLLKSQFIESASSFHYIAGIGTHAVADITLTPRPPQASIFENAYFIAASWGIAFFVPTVLLLYRRTALFFRRFSVFFTALLIAFSWLFARPNLLGWLILLILFLTILRIQWNKMRLVVTNLTAGGMRNNE